MGFEMPSSSVLEMFPVPDPVKTHNYFQRKVGSIRDNPKLLKIRQQFENASKNSNVSSSDYKKISCTSSFNMFKSAENVGENLFQSSDHFSLAEKSSGIFEIRKDISHNRRHSEGEIKYKNSFIVFDSKKNLSKFATNKTSDNLSLLKNGLSNISNKSVSSNSGLENENIFSNNSQTSSLDSKIYHNLSTCEERSNLLPDVVNNHSCSVSTQIAPPIPKRGISPGTPSSLIYSLYSSDMQKTSSSKESATWNAVQKAIEMYEGMSSKRKSGSNNQNQMHKKEHLVKRRSFLYRRNSRRNTSCKSENASDKEDFVITSKQTDIMHSKDDSGVGLSDTYEKNQSIYQTLSSVTNHGKESFNPYDRLNRFHDITNRIHKGKSSNCAACKAIPSNIPQCRTNDESVFHVRCNESDLHHHPPCICFSCQHSVFSCVEQCSSLENSEDSLYYNVCCLNPPNREGWRQSRRRPICEKNGRVCIVNCDMEKCSSICSQLKLLVDVDTKQSSECHLKSYASEDNDSKQHLGELYDSDEGWVDVTDSDEEKFLLNDKKFSSSSTDCNKIDSSMNYSNADILEENIKSFSKQADNIYSNQGLSQAFSTEHLYESIADIDSDSTEKGEKDENSPESSNKIEENLENDHDSGEWSTDSSSPTNDYSSDKDKFEIIDPSLSQIKMPIIIEGQERAKKNFMKSVLNKKSNSVKKVRMSTFFVPWLAVNNEYASASKSAKHTPKKQSLNGNSVNHANQKNRTNQVASCSPKISKSHSIELCNSVNASEEFGAVEAEQALSERLSRKSSDSIFPLPLSHPSPAHASNSSLASCDYITPDELKIDGSVKKNVPIVPNAIIDVAVERVCKRSLSNSSDHSYIFFKPVKEEDVPLYQFYERNMKERVSFCCNSNCSTPQMRLLGCENSFQTEPLTKSTTYQRSLVEQLSPDARDAKMLWCELPEVKDSGILERISAQELKLQEAIFDFIQSQASYLRSLRVLFENFICFDEFSNTDSSSCVLSKHEYDVLFSDVIRIKEVSESCLGELTLRWSDGILIPDVCDIIQKHVTLPSFSIYVKYCSNRMYQERTLKELKETRLCFLDVLRRLESAPSCQGLNLESFLFLPIQHIARLPLLLDNIFRWLGPDSPSFSICKCALEAVQKVFMACNEGARKMSRLEEMFVLNKQLEFKDCKVIPLISASRWLLKKGELLKLELDKKTFGRSSRCSRIPLYLFLFNDLLIFTKRKNDDCYLVVDYCFRKNIQSMAVDSKDLPIAVPNTYKYLIYLNLSKNHLGQPIDMIFNCSLLSERTRWIEALQHTSQSKSNDVWEYDCPQVQCVRSYTAQQPDELSLQESDIVSILRKMNDGWYEGRRLRDGLQGWFPASYTMDILCSRARASNLKQCYQLLMMSQV